MRGHVACQTQAVEPTAMYTICLACGTLHGSTALEHSWVSHHVIGQLSGSSALGRSAAQHMWQTTFTNATILAHWSHHLVT